MKEEWKVYIKAVSGRGEEVVGILQQHGGKQVMSGAISGDNVNSIYYIDHDGNIRVVAVEKETAKIIMDNYRELHLPEQWKDGDILVTDTGFFSIFREEMPLADYGGTNIITYCGVDEHQIWLSGCNKNTGRPHLATPSEAEHFHELLHKFGKDWDAENKQLVDWDWKPKVGEDYWFISAEGRIIKYAWNSSPADEIGFEFGNCFPSAEEAEAAAERVRKVLKGK